MKKLLFIFLLLPFIGNSQSTGYFRFDTSLFYKVGGNNEVIIQNSTRSLTRGFLQNYNNGRTKFATAVDSAWSSNDSLFVRRSADTLILTGIGGGLDTNAVWKQGGNWGFGTDGIFGTGSNHSILFKTNNVTRFKLYNNGNFVGGTSLTDDGHSFRWSGNMSFNLGSDAEGDVFYRNSSGTFTRLPIGASGDVLTSTGTLPLWATPTAYVDSIWKDGDSIRYRMDGIIYAFEDPSGGGSFINNNTILQTSANYNIDGTGITAFHKTNGTIATDVFNYHAGYNKTHFAYAGGAVGNTLGHTNGFFSGGVDGVSVPFNMIGYNAYWDGSNFIIPYAAGGVSLTEYKPDQINWRLTNSLTQVAFVNTTEYGIMTNLRINGSFEPNNLPGSTGQELISQGAGSNPIWKNRPTLSKSITVENPSSSELIDMWTTDVAITVTKVFYNLRGSSPSVTFDIHFDTDASSGSPSELFGTNVVGTSTTGTVNTTFSDATIPAGSRIWIITSATSGTITSIAFTIQYTED